jgi:hypothetical protein
MAKSVLTVSKLEKLDVDYEETGDALYLSVGPAISLYRIFSASSVPRRES